MKSAAMLAALEGLSKRGRRSALDDKLPEDKRGGLTIIIAGGGSPEESEPPSGEMEMPEEAMLEEPADGEEDELY